MASKKVESKIQLSFPVDKKRIEEIQKCLKKGKLSITISKVAAQKAGRAREGYIYD